VGKSPQDHRTKTTAYIILGAYATDFDLNTDIRREVLGTG